MNRKPGTATVFIVDDDPSVLRSLGRLMRAAKLPFATFPSAQEFLQQHKPSAAGCLVIDVTMPGLSGLDLQLELTRMGNHMPIVFLTGNGDIPMSVRAMKAGAANFLTKPCPDYVLLTAIHEALEIDEQRRSAWSGDREIKDRVATLTPREHEVMLGVIAGNMNKQIAAKLGAAVKTIKIHRSRVMMKLGVTSVAELVRVAERAGITPV